MKIQMKAIHKEAPVSKADTKNASVDKANNETEPDLAWEGQSNAKIANNRQCRRPADSPPPSRAPLSDPAFAKAYAHIARVCTFSCTLPPSNPLSPSPVLAHLSCASPFARNERSQRWRVEVCLKIVFDQTKYWARIERLRSFL